MTVQAQAIWSDAEELFVALTEVVKHKASLQEEEARRYLEAASAAFAQASQRMDVWVNGGLRNQTDHYTATALSRMLLLAKPLLDAMTTCFASHETQQAKPPRGVLDAMQYQVDALVPSQVASYLSALLLEHPVGRVLEILSDDENGVGQVIIGLGLLLRQQKRAHLARSYVDSLGTLSPNCDSVEVGPGVDIGIGDMPDSAARVLLAQRFLAIRGEW